MNPGTNNAANPGTNNAANGAAPGAVTHGALIYRRPDELLAAARAFVEAGLANGEPVRVIAAGERLDRLRAEVGRGDTAVQFVDVGRFYRSLPVAARAVIGWLSHARGTRCRLFAEHDLTGRGDAEIEDYLRFEAAANVLYRAYPLTMLCAYDAAALPGNVILGCLRTHPELLANHHLQPNDQFVDPRAYIATRSTVTQPPVSADYFACYTRIDLAAARSFTRARAALAGLEREATANLVQAVTEVLTNALLHGRPPRRLYVYTEGPALVCHVHDSGRGLSNHLVSYLPPGNGSGHGRGLWLARQLCDVLEIATDETGTHVRMLVALP